MQEIFYFKKIFRDIETSTTKCVHLNGGIEFNKTCLTNGNFPKYRHNTYVYKYYKYCHNTIEIYLHHSVFYMYALYILLWQMWENLCKKITQFITQTQEISKTSHLKQ